MKALDSNHMGQVLFTLALFFVVCGYSTRLVGEEVLRENAPPSSKIALEITANAISGTIMAASLDKVMDRICRAGAFRCQLIKQLSDYTISRQFKNEPVVEAIKSLLESFDYILISNPKGNIEQLSVVGLKNEHRPQISFDQLGLDASSKGLPMSPEPQALPPFTSVINKTGPVTPEGAVSKKLPEFTPVTNDTGPPVDSTSETTPLPPFLPLFPGEANNGAEHMQ